MLFFSVGKGRRLFPANPWLGGEDNGEAAGGAELTGRQVPHFASLFPLINWLALRS